MSKIRHRPTEDGGLCVVNGRFLMADGTPFTGRLILTPQKSGRWQGVFYAAQPFTVKPDTGGYISVSLPPSVAVGNYKLVSRPPAFDMVFAVPEDEYLIDLGDLL